MADQEHLDILKQGVEAWNDWRTGQDEGFLIRADLSGADLIRADLSRADLSRADLSRADLSRTDLRKANLSEANLGKANLGKANLIQADLSGANLIQADLRLTNLSKANLSKASLSKADLGVANLTEAGLERARLEGAIFDLTDLNNTDFRQAILFETHFPNVDLSKCKNLETCRHMGPSYIDFGTLQRSGPLPLAFLRSSGLPDKLIEYLPSLLGTPIQHYSCLISYSSKDDDFVRRLHADLQDKGVRCWFAPEDMKIGAKILDTIDEAIRLRDKVLLALSETSIASEWVEDEVTKAFAEERRRSGITVLFPIRLDDTVLETNEAWALKVRDNRNIGDFRRWKEHDVDQKALARLLRDLQIEAA